MMNEEYIKELSCIYNMFVKKIDGYFKNYTSKKLELAFRKKGIVCSTLRQGKLDIIFIAMFKGLIKIDSYIKNNKVNPNRFMFSDEIYNKLKNYCFDNNCYNDQMVGFSIKKEQRNTLIEKENELKEQGIYGDSSRKYLCMYIFSNLIKKGYIDKNLNLIEEKK
jgi:hypothetical protein